MPALSFVLLIGVNPIAEAFHFKTPKGYTYFAIGFSIAVALLNMRGPGHKPVTLHDTGRHPDAR